MLSQCLLKEFGVVIPRPPKLSTQWEPKITFSFDTFRKKKAVFNIPTRYSQYKKDMNSNHCLYLSVLVALWRATEHFNPSSYGVTAWSQALASSILKLHLSLSIICKGLPSSYFQHITCHLYQQHLPIFFLNSFCVPGLSFFQLRLFLAFFDRPSSEYGLPIVAQTF